MLDNLCKVAIEIDGEHHYNKKHPYYKETLINNDRQKENYIENKGYTLIRIRTKQHYGKMPFKTFLYNKCKSLTNLNYLWTNGPLKE